MIAAGRIILHVDMDAFFASVEVLDNPALKGKPVIVGGTPEGHGVVAAASYEARTFGIRSAMPTATALRLCPHAIVIRSRGRRYAEISEAIMEIIHSFTPIVQQTSVDEAFLDVTASTALYGDGRSIASQIKKRIRSEIGLTCSIGVAPNRFLAKLASDLEKPDGLTVIREETAARRIAPLPVNRIWGIGPRTADLLKALGIDTIGQLASYPTERLERRLGHRATELQDLARGRDDSVVMTEHDPKSISRETTFAEFLTTNDEAESVLLEFSDEVASTLREEQLMTSTVTIKVRDESFRTFTRSRVLNEPTDLGETIYAAARDLLRKRVQLNGKTIRLLGVGAANLLKRSDVPPELLPDHRTIRRHTAAIAVDRIRSRYGATIVKRGAHVKPRKS